MALSCSFFLSVLLVIFSLLWRKEPVFMAILRQAEVKREEERGKRTSKGKRVGRIPTTCRASKKHTLQSFHNPQNW